jgi:hypothetical protein
MDPLNSTSIPVMRSPADIMNDGLNSDNLAAGAVQSHPIDRMQRGKQVRSNCSDHGKDSKIVIQKKRNY